MKTYYIVEQYELGNRVWRAYEDGLMVQPRDI